MEENAADFTVHGRPKREPGQRLIVKARHQQRLACHGGRHIGAQAEQVWPRDDGVELVAPLLQCLDQYRCVNALPQITLLHFRRDLTVGLHDGAHDLAMGRRIVRRDREAMNRHTVDRRGSGWKVVFPVALGSGAGREDFDVMAGILQRPGHGS